jgi:hypothetical protein
MKMSTHVRVHDLVHAVMKSLKVARQSLAFSMPESTNMLFWFSKKEEVARCVQVKSEIEQNYGESIVDMRNGRAPSRFDHVCIGPLDETHIRPQCTTPTCRRFTPKIE